MALLQWNSSPVPIAIAAIETRFHRVLRRIDVVVASPFSAVSFSFILAGSDPYRAHSA